MTMKSARIIPFRISIILYILIIILALAARSIPGARTIDDAYITFRYARNILAGNGFVFNPAERVLGTTTPFYTILLVTISSLLGGAQAPFPQIALWINALADSITCLLLIAIGRRLGFLRAGWAAALTWAVAPFSVTFAIGGLETSVYVLLITALAAAHLYQRRWLAAALAALALLTRPDALLFILPLGLNRLQQIWFEWRKTKTGIPPLDQLTRLTDRSSRLVELLIFSVPVFLWLIFATLYFGSPIPHSIAAKSLAYRLSSDAAFIRLIQHYSTPFLEHLTFGPMGITIGMILYIFLSILGMWRILRRNGLSSGAWPVLVYPWLYFFAFSIANPLIFRWYLTPPLPFYFLTLLSGADALLDDLVNRATRWLPMPGMILFTALLVFTPFCLTLRGWSIHPDHGLPTPAPEMAWYRLELLYHQAAARLVEETGPNPSPLPLLAAGDVGVLGYDTPTRILDTVGLNSPQALRYYPLDPSFYVINYAVAPALILDEKPDYIIILEAYGRAGLLKDKQFQETYHLLDKIPTDIYGSDGMLIFSKE